MAITQDRFRTVLDIAESLLTTLEHAEKRASELGPDGVYMLDWLRANRPTLTAVNIIARESQHYNPARMRENERMRTKQASRRFRRALPTREYFDQRVSAQVDAIVAEITDVPTMSTNYRTEAQVNREMVAVLPPKPALTTEEQASHKLGLTIAKQRENLAHIDAVEATLNADRAVRARSVMPTREWILAQPEWQNASEEKIAQIQATHRSPVLPKKLDF